MTLVERTLAERIEKEAADAELLVGEYIPATCKQLRAIADEVRMLEIKHAWVETESAIERQAFFDAITELLSERDDPDR